MRFRALIVDDEPPARKRISDLLKRAPDVRVAGEHDNGGDALCALRSDPVELLFLDIQMPGLDGFELLHQLEPARAPVTIFVTAFDRYALQAFDAHAIDYLLKPFSDERFEEALQRARVMIGARDRTVLDRRLEALLSELSSRRPERLERIAIKNAGRVSFVDVDEIDWIEAAGVYVTIHARERDHLLRESLASLEAKLDPARFKRIHRQAIVSLDRVREIRSDLRGRQRVVLADGSALKLSRTHREALERAMELGGS